MVAPVLSLVLLAFAVSLDGFGVGMTYGIRKIKIPLLSVMIISACSGLVVLLSMMVGVAAMSWMTPHGASAVGAVILIGIGGYALIQFVRSGECEPIEPVEQRAALENETSEPMLKIELKVFGLIIQIIRTPSAADVDRSGTISSKEAFFLGTALSLDAFGAGIGAALVGFPPLYTSVLIAVSSGLFLLSGTRVGFKVARWRWVRQMSMLPGIILIVMGIFKLFL